MQREQQQTNLIGYNSLHDFHKGSCGYCDNKNVSQPNRGWYTAGLVCRKMGLEIYQSLMDKGWRRCGTYYYRADVDRCCCRPYSIRLCVHNFQIRPSQKKALKKFQKFLDNDGKKVIKNEEKNLKPKPLESNQKKVSMEIENSEDDAFLSFLDEILRKELSCFLLNFSKELKNLLNIQETEKNFVLTDEMNKNIKFLKPNSKKFDKNHFLTNFLMIFFSKNKDILGISKMKIEEFVDKIKLALSQFLSDFLHKTPYKTFQTTFQVQPNGYIFFELLQPNLEKKNSEKKLNRSEEEKKEENPKKDPNSNKKEKKDLRKEEVKPFTQKKEEEKKQEEIIKNDLELRIQKAQFEQESFELYKKYCHVIHQKENESASGYTRFLCEQALEYETFKSGNEELMCGCYHMKYYYKGKLIAVGVVDIFPTCLSSVYFFYDPDPVYKKLGLGIVSSLKEIEWIQRKQQKFPDFKYYYLGFYIQSCQKMVYKGDYEPSELLCPITYRWVTLDENLRKLIDRNEVSSQLAPANSAIIEEMKFKDLDELNKLIDKKIRINLSSRSVAIKDLRSPYNKVFRDLFQCLVKVWGKKVVDYLYFGDD